MRILFIFLVLCSYPASAVTLKCRTGQGKFILTTAQYCPDGSTFIDADYGGLSDYRSSQSRVTSIQDRDCTSLKMQADSIAFRIRRGRSFSDDEKNYRNLQSRIGQNGC